MSFQRNRIPGGDALDRSRTLAFRFDGRAFEGYAGDTLASALLANGVRLFGRSFKYHRPRGVLGIGAEEPNALVRVGGPGREEPNLRATEVDLHAGLQATSQNRWPSLRFDAGAVNNVLGSLLPAGFYYKTFKWPASWWPLYEHLIRRAAGLGQPPQGPDPDSYAKRFAHCDVLVVGAGPAGLAAARAAARAGARVILADEGRHPGGSLLRDEETIDGESGAAWARTTVSELDARGGVRVLRRAIVFGHYDQNLLGIAERVWDHVSEPPPHQPRQRLWWVRTKRVVVCAGAIERPLVFADNDLPGVMLASAARGYARQYAVRCGERAVLFTCTDDAYRSAAALAAVGVDVRAVVDARPQGPGAAARALLAGSGAQLLAGQAVVRAEGGKTLAGVQIRDYDGASDTCSGVAHRIECDLLCVSGGWSPSVHLFSQARGTLGFDDRLAAFVPDNAPAASTCAGACNGTLDVAGCLAEGARAGAEAAGVALGRSLPPAEIPFAEDEAMADPLALWDVPSAPGQRGKRFVDYQNDVTADDLALAAREGYTSVEHLKRYTTLGMGTDQGRTSNVNGLAILAGRLDAPIPVVGTTTFRPPFSPVTLGAIAGPETGANLAPLRRTPLDDWHASAGARFVPAGLWRRAEAYPRSGERFSDTVARETRAVRQAVGLVDVSTLGKIEVRGRDAAEFLERMYVNRWRKLAIGRVRYGLMLREDGFVLDDGTTTRIGETEYYMTTTTAQAAAVLAHLEFYAQTVWPDLNVRLCSVSDQWAGMALAGPRARAVLTAACSGAALDDVSLPHMGFTPARIAGVAVRIFRMSFSGEMAFEVHVAAGHARAVWEALLAAGQAHGIAPYGTETMSVLRIEKGHVAGPELDGTTLASDFGFDSLYRRKPGDFVGRRALERPALDGTRARRRLVGLVSDDGRPIPSGAHLVESADATPPLATLGRVTSTCYSPTLGESIALALLTDAPRAPDTRLHAAAPLVLQRVPVRIVDPVFVDPEGLRTRG